MKMPDKNFFNKKEIKHNLQFFGKFVMGHFHENRMFVDLNQIGVHIQGEILYLSV